MRNYSLGRLLFFVLFVAISISTSEAITPFQKFQVVLVNYMEKPDILNFHCYGSEELGMHYLQGVGASYDFSFAVNAEATTEYSCDLWWTANPSQRRHVTIKAFENKDDFISNCGKSICLWTATPEGIYSTNVVTKVKKIMYEWQNWH
ncbi:hypothetical protein ACFE04_022307 [Oxalis oulophora]